MRGPTDPHSRLLPGKDHFTSTEGNRNGCLMERCLAAPSARRERIRRRPRAARGLRVCCLPQLRGAGAWELCGPWR